MMFIGYVRRGSLDSPRVNRDNQSNSLYLKLRCLFLFRTWDVASLIIWAWIISCLRSVCYLYIAHGSCNTGTLDLVCLHYIVTAWHMLCHQFRGFTVGNNDLPTLKYQINEHARLSAFFSLKWIRESPTYTFFQMMCIGYVRRRFLRFAASK